MTDHLLPPAQNEHAEARLGRRTSSTMVWGQVAKSLEGLLAIATAVAAVRALNPNAFGLYSLLTYMAGSASVFIPIVLVEAAGAVIPRFRDARERLSVTAFVAGLRLLMILVAVLLLIPGWTAFRDMFGLDAISVRVFLVGAVYWTVQDLLNSISSYYAIELDLRPVALWKPVGQTVSLVAIVLIAATEDRWASSVGEVLAAVTLGYVITIVGLLLALRRHGLPRLPALSSTRTVLSYTRHTWLIGILSLAVSTPADVLLIGAITADPRQVAFYVAAFAIVIRAQLFLLSGWLAPMIPALSRAHLQGGRGGMARAWELFAQLWLFVSLPALTLVLALAVPLVDVLFGAEYGPAGGLLAWAAGFSLAYAAVGGPLGTNALWALDCQYVVTRIRGVAAIAVTTLAVVLISWNGALGAIIATGTALVGTALGELYFARRAGGVRYPFGFAGRVLVASIAGAAPTLVVHPEGPLAVAGCGLAGIGVYVTACLLLRPFAPDDLLVLERASPWLAASPLRRFARS